MTWKLWGWIVWIGGFAVLETLGLLNEGMTLTYFLEHHVPKWLMAAFLGWMAYHFLIAPLARR